MVKYQKLPLHYDQLLLIGQNVIFSFFLDFSCKKENLNNDVRKHKTKILHDKREQKNRLHE